MVSLRFPFLFSQPTWPSRPSSSARPFSATTVAFTAAAVGATAAVAALTTSQNPTHTFLQNASNLLFSSNHSLPLWGSLTLADNSPPIVESKTGASFPSVLGDSQKLLGIGLRKKSILGLRNIDVYAFGIYADDSDIKKLLSVKYQKLSVSEIKGIKDFNVDLMENDICMTVRLQIVYSKLSIRSVRNAFEESVGSRLKKFGGSDNKELLQRFTSQFKDEYKIPRGSVIHLSREKGHVLHTTIDGKDVGSIQSKLLCQSILDLYIGEEPFDKQAKKEIELNLASLQK
ncbi:fatty-acid-binding protein 1 [Quillaja saponaria]|uniref:Fatty-acid-binding protein 1 n=1 Tax=Quillaja saponaria TaxID=32244 RepID=A0AAD7VEE8_QUISA|nr:fatty-acid-binding protein 1 [Quillaja saponaria]